MSDCRRTTDRLTSYVDDALGPADRAEVEQHLAACPPCRDVAAREEGGRTLLRTRADQLRAEPLPPGLRTRCEALARAHGTPSPSAGWRTRLMPVSLVAVLLIFTASALFSVATHRSDALLAAQLTADHSKCFKIFVPADAEAVDAAAVEDMLADRHGWDVHVPPSAPDAGVQLIGARRCLWADGRVPHVMYRVDGKDVSLYMLEGVTRDEADVLALGHRSRIWSRGATTYVLVSHREAGDLSAALRYIRQEAH